MNVFRIAKTAYINDLTGTGAKSYGGRWNRKGTAMIYTAESRSLASVEYLVHMPMAITPNDLSIACIEIPDGITSLQFEASRLPKNWREYPAPDSLATMGNGWAKEGKSLLLRVPSAVIEDEFNILINPLHSDFKAVKITEVKKYFFDDRLMRH